MDHVAVTEFRAFAGSAVHLESQSFSFLGNSPAHPSARAEPTTMVRKRK